MPSYFLDEHTEFAIKADDTIIAMSGATVGKCTLVTEKDIPALLNQRVGRFKVKNGIDKKFVYYTVSNYSYQQKLLLDAIGGAQPNVSPRQIESVLCSIPIKADGTPDLAEQRRIAGILSSADGAIAASEALIEKYRNIKRGLLATLLQPKEGWKKVKLGECCEKITDGSHDSPKPVDDGYFMPSVKDMRYDDFDFSDCKQISKIDFERLKGTGCKPEIGDVLIAKDGSILKYCFVVKQDLPIVVLSSIAILRPNQSIVDGKYLSYYFQKQDVVTDVVENYKSGTGVPRIVLRNFEQIEIHLPDLTEQRRIAEILSSVDAKIAAEEKVVEKYKGVKKGLMEEMMRSGK